MTRFLCCGDLHLGAGPDYGREPGSRLADQARVWNRIIDLAIEEDVDAILFAGDAFERRRPTPSELSAFAQPLGRLFDSDIECLAVVGNHDVEHADRITALELFVGGIGAVHREPGLWHALDSVTVATLPWAPVSRLVASLNGGDRDDIHQRAAELLIDTARGLRAQIDGPAVLLCHWSISGAALPTGLPTDQLREVVLPLAELEAMGWDAIVAGHIHRPQFLSSLGGSADGLTWVRTEQAETWAPALYVGSPLPLNFGEAATEHGVWLLELAGDVFVPRFLPIDSRPFRTIDVDMSGVATDDPTDLIITAAVRGTEVHGDLADAIVKVRYQATEDQARRVDVPRLKAALYEAGAHKVYAVEATVERAVRARVEGLDSSLGELEALDLYIAAEGIDDEMATRMRERTAQILEGVR